MAAFYFVKKTFEAVFYLQIPFHCAIIGGSRYGYEKTFMKINGDAEMKQYRVKEGLFFSERDRELYMDRINTTEIGARFRENLIRGINGRKIYDIPALRFDWYEYNIDMDHSTSVSNYQNFNGILGRYLNGMIGRMYSIMLASELLGMNEYDAEIHDGMLRLPEEYPLHLFVMCDLGLILYGFIDRFFRILDAKRGLFTEEEQWKLDNFARSIVMDIRANQEEWLTSRTGQQHCNNHMLAHSLAVIEGGLYYDRADWVKYGLHNREGIYTYLEDGASDRGIGIEASFKYNMLTLSFMTHAAELLNRAGGDDLYSYRNSRGYTLADFFTEAPGYLTPDEKLVPLGDNYGHYPELGKIDVVSDAVLALGDKAPGLKYFVRNSVNPAITLSRLALGDIDDSPVPPEAFTEIYENFGVSIVKAVQGREYWNSDSLLFAMRSGRSRIHNNADQMAVLLYGCGEYIIRDFEGIDRTSMHGFSSDIQRKLNRSRLAHSGVMCDGKDSRSFNEDLPCEYVCENGVQKVTVTDENGLLYPGISQKRTLTLCGDTLTDEYILSSETEHTYDYIVHIFDDRKKPEYEKNPDVINKLFPMNPTNPAFEWIFSPEVSETDGNVNETWQSGGAFTEMSLTSGVSGKKMIFSLPEASDLSMRATKSLLLRAEGKSACFKAVYRIRRV